MKFTIELNAYELREAAQAGLLDSLARLETQDAPAEGQPIRTKEPPAQTQTGPEPAAVTAPRAQAPRETAPPQPVPVQAPGDPAAAQATQAAVPVQAVAYTMEQLGKSAMSIADSQGHQVIADLLKRFGVESLTLLPKEQYGAFAAELRNLGAKL